MTYFRTKALRSERMGANWMAVLCIVLLATAIFFQAPANAIETVPDEAAYKAAQKGLQDLSRTIADRVKRAKTGISYSLEIFGFESYKQYYEIVALHPGDSTGGLRLGNPMRLFRVDRNQLKEFTESSDPVKLLVDTNQMIYPVSAGNEVRMLLTVMKNKQGKWKTAEWGAPKLAKALSNTTKSKKDFVVSVPALNRYFVGTPIGAQFELASIPDGGFLPAKDVFLKLQPEALARPGGLR